jgi:hypothetical protein
LDGHQGVQQSVHAKNALVAACVEQDRRCPSYAFIYQGFVYQRFMHLHMRPSPSLCRMPATITTATIGYPRTGPRREMKKALESYWAGKTSKDDLITASQAVEEAAWRSQADAGIELVSVDGTFYDHVLDIASCLGLLPERFANLSGLDAYFAAARGADDLHACDMSKYYDTNYHYIVPELGYTSTPKPDWEPLLDRARRCQAAIGVERAVPLLAVGPLSFVHLAKGEFDRSEMIARLIPAYVDFLEQLGKLGVPEVQVLNSTLFFPFSLYCLRFTPHMQNMYIPGRKLLTLTGYVSQRALYELNALVCLYALYFNWSYSLCTCTHASVGGFGKYTHAAALTCYLSCNQLRFPRIVLYAASLHPSDLCRLRPWPILEGCLSGMKLVRIQQGSENFPLVTGLTAFQQRKGRMGKGYRNTQHS